MPKPLKILYVCAEAAPLAKTGGLGDVSNALPGALRASGHDVRIAMPCYGTIPERFKGEAFGTCFAHLDSKVQYGAVRKSELPGSRVPVYLIENGRHFDRGYVYGTGGREDDDLERFCFFCLAVLDAAPQTGWKPDVVHAHDWHTAPIPVYLKTRFARHPWWAGTPTVFTMHTVAYQGQFPPALYPKTGLDPGLYTPDCLEFFGRVNLLKGAIRFADKLNTVSPNHAKEICTPQYGYGLEGFIRRRAKNLTGILNGVDYTIWNPARDTHLVANYSLEMPEGLSGKRLCKRALQMRCGLGLRDDVPLFGMVTRLAWEKGIDFLLEALPVTLARDLQVVILGMGEPQYESALADFQRRWPDKLSVSLRQDDALAHQIFAGSDFYLMPSRVEPGGLSQLYGMAYGAVPVVRATGGIADTVCGVTAADLARGTASGVVFRPATAEAVVSAVASARRLYRNRAKFDIVQRTGMKQDFSWDKSCRKYEELYRSAIAQSCPPSL